MKKQINPSIKAHLVRGAFYLLLLIAVCAIPFALAQRSRLLPNDVPRVPILPRLSQVPQKTSGIRAAHIIPIPRPPKAPQVVLYDQYDNAGLNATFSGTFTDFVGFDADLADDFVVPAGQTWNVESIDADGVYFNGSGPANSFNVFVYSDSGGLPGTQVYSTLNQPWVQSGTTFTVTLSPAAVLSPGTYWIEIQANMTFAVGGQWGWTDRTVQSNSPAAWQNPGGGFGVCTSWGQRANTCLIDPGVPDQVYRINGTTGGGGSPSPTATATATPTGSPASCSWSGAPDLPQAGTRLVGVFFPANGKFYAMGGRDVNNVEFTNPFEFDPASNTWTTKSAMYPDASTNNMACSVLNDSGTDYIYCVGGSNFAAQTATDRVFRYDPVADSITTVAASWPPGVNSILPGGFSVFSNKFYIFGGFDIPNGVGIDQIWQFTPNPAGFVQQGTSLPVPLGYIPTTTIGSLIYMGGGADITGGVLTDTQNSFVYDPTADSITTIAQIPRPTSNTRAVNFCNQMYVLGGAFNTPSNEVDIYDPVSNTWSLGAPFPTEGRNFAADTDGSSNIWKAGGYASDGVTIIATTEIFNCPVSPCAPSPTPTPSATPTATATPTSPPVRATPTPRPRPTAPAPRP